MIRKSKLVSVATAATVLGLAADSTAWAQAPSADTPTELGEISVQRTVMAPSALYELGAEVFPIGVSTDGFKINREVGATDTDALKAAVQSYRADIGIALDGDADRCIIIDADSHEIDGDQLTGLIAGHWQAACPGPAWSRQSCPISGLRPTSNRSA